MSCAFSREVLALYVGGELSESSARSTRAHVSGCAECAEFCERLDNSRSMLRALRSGSPSSADLTGVRKQVLSRIESTKDALGWALRIERFFFLQLFRRPVAVVALAACAIVSLSLLAHPGELLQRPADYRNWVLVGDSSDASRAAPAHHVVADSSAFSRVYIEPAAFRTFQSSGKFPEGTTIVLELTNANRDVQLQVSIKDSARFAGGWGYFGFGETAGTQRTKEQTFSDADGCHGCHESKAETDHVFTQFYPVLKAGRG
jgi:hypothetical protein